MKANLREIKKKRHYSEFFKKELVILFESELINAWLTVNLYDEMGGVIHSHSS